MGRDFSQVGWSDAVEEDCRQLVRLAIREDFDRFYDWTTVALVSEQAQGEAAIVSRELAIVAGLPAVRVVIDEMQAELRLNTLVEDGATVSPSEQIATLQGSARDLLACERIVLNLLGRLSGVATRTRAFVEEVAGTNAKVYDTRKTTPGWRLLEKYAVHVGGGQNHRLGLYDAILIKDNHLALRKAGGSETSPAGAVVAARRFIDEMKSTKDLDRLPLNEMIVEIEVDTLEQLQDVLSAAPDIVLLDNMSPDELRQAVDMRNASAPQIQLEASGGVDYTTVGKIAETGVDRISVGGLTHAAHCVDFGLDWLP